MQTALARLPALPCQCAVRGLSAGGAARAAGGASAQARAAPRTPGGGGGQARARAHRAARRGRTAGRAVVVPVCAAAGRDRHAPNELAKARAARAVGPDRESRAAGTDGGARLYAL